MDKVIYLAMSAADQMMSSQSVHANNLANANTVGFRSELEYFTNQAVKGPGKELASRPYSQNVYSDFTAGGTISTGRDLDVAIQGDGFFSVQTQDGSEAYTRSGEFQLSPEGFLLTKSGDQVLGNGGPIVLPPEQHVLIANDGSISIVPLGNQTSPPVLLDRLKLVSPDLKNIAKKQNGLFYTRDGKNLEADASVHVAQRAVEGSNVNAVSEMVSMMQMSRNFELQLKLMKESEKNDQQAAELMKWS